MRHSFRKKLNSTILACALLFPSFAQADNLTIYSSRQIFLLDPILESLTENTNMETGILYSKKGIFERLQTEGSGSPADIVISNDVLLLDAITKGGLADPISDEELLKRIPAHLRHKDNSWVGLSLRGRIVYINKQQIRKDEITDYLDLTKFKYRNSICIRPWTHPYNVGLVAYIISKLGEEKAEEWVRGVNSNLARKPKGNDRAQIRGVNSGECNIAIANSYYLGVMQSDPKQISDTVNVTQIFPSLDGKHGTMPTLSGALILKNSRNKESSLKLLQAMTSQKGQNLYTTLNHELPIKTSFASAIQMQQAEALDTGNIEDILPFRRKALEIITKVSQ